MVQFWLHKPKQFLVFSSVIFYIKIVSLSILRLFLIQCHQKNSLKIKMFQIPEKNHTDTTQNKWIIFITCNFWNYIFLNNWFTNIHIDLIKIISSLLQKYVCYTFILVYEFYLLDGNSPFIRQWQTRELYHA